MVRRALFLLAGLAVLAALGWSVRDFETLIASGEEVLLELAPVDPRSLMQGDYMRLNWALDREPIALDAAGGTVILGLDERRIGRYRRLGATPGPGEVAFTVKAADSGEGVRVEPRSFLFQEGQADLFANARFGIFRVDANGRHLLVGLADADTKRIGAP